jgi:glycosyltransferase involved in cell wall biosynthesis
MPLDGFALDRFFDGSLRVALFSGNYNYTLDGANKALNRLVDHLQRAEGAHVRVYSPTSPTPAFAPVGDLVSVPSIAIPTRADYRLALGLPAAIRRDIETFGPDVIHLSAPDLLGGAALKLGRRLGVPVVASVHTLFDTYLDYYGAGWLRSVVAARLRQFYAACDYVLVPTQAVADELAGLGLEGRLRPWTRGVDADLFTPTRRDPIWRRAQGFQDDEVVVLFFGRVVLEKGLAVFVDSVRRLDATGARYKVLVVGDGPARPWLESQLPNAVFTGLLSGEPLARAVASADILLNPSSTEAFCNVTLESMASGLALVCADAPNNRSLLRDGENGVLCPPKDADAYASALEALIQQPLARRRLGRGAHAASARYVWRDILAKVAAVYREAAYRPLDVTPATHPRSRAGGRRGA